jgi:ABC-2 type transport system ATP-binding protein
VLDVRHDDESVLDAVRDTVADLGIGLLRLEPRRHGLAEIFADEPAGAAIVSDSIAAGGADVG